MPRICSYPTLLAAGIFASSWMAASSLADTVGNSPSIVPHEVVYDITVKAWKRPRHPDSITGKAIMRLKESCTAWNTEMSVYLEPGPGSRTGFLLTISTLQTERFDGSELEFQHKYKVNSVLVMEMLGIADRTNTEARGAIAWQKPAKRLTDLPAGTLFPWQSRHKALADIRRGKRFSSRSVFAGSRVTPVRVAETLTRLVRPATATPRGDAWLLNAKAWRVAGSTSNDAKEDSIALNNHVGVFHANGVSSFIRIDTPDVVLDLHASYLKALPRAKC